MIETLAITFDSVCLSKTKRSVRELDTEAPKPTKGDVAHTLAKAGLSAIPIVGGPAAQIFSVIIIPPLARRRDAWVESIATALKELKGKVDGFKIENLRDNEIFITTVMHATSSDKKSSKGEIGGFA